MLGCCSSHMRDFWQSLDALVESSRLIIDRPRGSSHPRYPDLVYPLDYGYLEGTSAVDGDGVDVWRGSAPESGLDALICTADLEGREAEIKLLIGCSADEKQVVLDFHNQGLMAGILVERADG